MKRPALAIVVLLAAALAATVPAGAQRPLQTADDATIVHVLNRIAFGPRPGDVERVRAMGVAAYIEQQLHPEKIADEGMAARLAGLTTLNLTTPELLERYQQPLLQARRQRQATGAAGAPDAPRPPMARDPNAERPNAPLLELSQQKLLLAIHSERQLQEVLTDFWFNHFNVDARKGPVRYMLTEYEREAIRPHVLGRFRDLLGATAKSPAMLFYLDNWLSAGETSTRTQRQQRTQRQPRTQRAQRPQPQAQPQAAAMRRGLNENYARELMELHTLGVDGGYTQKDVAEVARAFTGWTIRNPRAQGDFVFEPRLHDGGDKTVLGRRISGGGAKDGEQVLDLLAAHPATARFISTKLARRFVADEPPAALVERLAARFTATGGDLREVMRTLLTSPEFLSPAAQAVKTKSPLEFVVSAARATGGGADVRPLVRSLQELGMPLYQCQPPTGYKDTADAWINTGALVARMNVAQAIAGGGSGAPGWLVLSEATRATVDRAADSRQALALTLGSPEFQKR